MCFVQNQYKGGVLRPPPQRGAAFGKVKECCSQTSFSELSTGTRSSPRGGRGQRKSAEVKECCSKRSGMVVMTIEDTSAKTFILDSVLEAFCEVGKR